MRIGHCQLDSQLSDFEGHYSNRSAYMKFHRQGREFPVFEHKGLKYGVLYARK